MATPFNSQSLAQAELTRFPYLAMGPYTGQSPALPVWRLSHWARSPVPGKMYKCLKHNLISQMEFLKR